MSSFHEMIKTDISEELIQQKKSHYLMKIFMMVWWNIPFRKTSYVLLVSELFIGETLLLNGGEEVRVLD